MIQVTRNVFFLWLITGFTSAETYYVIPTPVTHCIENGVLCMTLSQYVDKSHDLFDSNTTLILLPGNHSLDSEFVVSNITNLTISASLPDTTVTCSQLARFRLENISYIYISGIQWLGCVNNSIKSAYLVAVEYCIFNGQNCNQTGLTIGGVFLVSISNCTFSKMAAERALSSSLASGGAVLVYTSYYIFIVNSSFHENSASINGVVHIFDCTYTVIKNGKFANNSANLSGAAMIINSTVTIHNSVFTDNIALFNIERNASYGGALSVIDCNVSIDNSAFLRNGATYGGALSFIDSVSITRNSTFLNNVADSGGAVYLVNTLTSVNRTVSFQECALISNEAFYHTGGALHMEYCTAAVSDCVFVHNIAKIGGGALYVLHSSVLIQHNTFLDNHGLVRYSGGGVLTAICIATRILVEDSVFVNNSAQYGGAVYANNQPMYCSTMTKNQTGSLLNLSNTYFTENKAGWGAAIHAESVNVVSNSNLSIQNNSADIGVIYFERSAVSFTGKTTVIGNQGSLYSFTSSILFLGYTNIMNNSVLSSASVGSLTPMLMGGSVTSFQSDLHFIGTANLMYNEAQNGGAILAKETVAYFAGNTTIAFNYASFSGGGIHAYQSEIVNEGTTYIMGNTALTNGGGIHAISSTTKLLEGSLLFIQNQAVRGGGVCLEVNSKLHVIKSMAECDNGYLNVCSLPNDWLHLNFTSNFADYGGAVYVSDYTDYGTCSTTEYEQSLMTNECFLQAFGVSVLPDHLYLIVNINIRNTAFTNNTARVAGDVLFGGLLDRCAVGFNVEYFLKYRTLQYTSSSVTTLSYLLNVTNLEQSLLNSDISSHAVRLCYCRDGQPDCNYQPPTMYVMKGHPFNVSLVAVDQVNNTVPHSTIRGTLSSGHGRLSEGQSRQNTNESCTELQYNVFSPCDNETLLLYAEGPCNDTGISKRLIEVEFSPCHCPIGFEPVDTPTECDCQCDPHLRQYTTQCFYSNKSLLRDSDFWITIISSGSNESESELFVYPHCPFDYCRPSTEPVYLTMSVTGLDEQCAFNHSGVLCGSCQEGLSLSLGSSRCMPCTNHWLALLIPFAIAGMVLVAFLLVLNLTVAVGTLNGLIFYANIISANYATFLSSKKTNILSIFISLLNLDFGFQTCFYDGMDGYAKVWLQLAFPVYIILLVAMIMIIGEHFELFAKLLRLVGSNTVATLDSLVLLSYAKLLRTIIAALSFTVLEYPDGSHERVWLYDANIPYLEGKHIPLFIAALLILLVGVVLTSLLFTWQWLLHLSNKSAFSWVNNDKLKAFIDPFIGPYTDKHRYWTGLLLVARVVLYVIFALNVFGDVKIDLLSIICVVGALLLFKEETSNIYQDWHVNTLESSFIFNLLILCAATLYTRETKGDQTTLTNTSMSIAFITFVCIISYHTWLVLKKHVERLKNSIGFLNRPQQRISIDLTTPPDSPSNVIECTYAEIDGNPSSEMVNDNDDAMQDTSVDGTRVSSHKDASGMDVANTDFANESEVVSLVTDHAPVPPLNSIVSSDMIELSIVVEDKEDEGSFSLSEDETVPLLTAHD